MRPRKQAQEGVKSAILGTLGDRVRFGPFWMSKV